MSENATVETFVPLDVLNRFEKLEGIPLSVIAELFNRMKLPADLQVAFWEAAAAKQLKDIYGKVHIIKTNRDGAKEVSIIGTGGYEGQSLTLRVPDDLTDEQLAELKRAQGARLKVSVIYQLDEGKKLVNSVTVYEDESVDKSEKKFF